MVMRALLAFLALPGVVALLVPLLLASLDPWRGPPRLWGLGIMLVGAGVLLWCVRDFFVSGKGTLAPWAPPTRLVVVGLYRHVRNPMYVGVLLLVLGWSVALSSGLVAGYALVLALSVHLRVVLGEEPWLAARFPADWAVYRGHVPRWWPRWSAWKPDA